MGGAFGRVAEDDTAFPNRAAQYRLNVYGFWADPADDADPIGWVRRTSDAVRPHVMAGQDVNFLGQDGADPDSATYSVGPFPCASTFPAASRNRQ